MTPTNPAAPTSPAAPAPRAPKLHSTACERNREPIAAALAEILPPGPGPVLEIAAGTGMHAAWFAARFPDRTWLPTDFDATALGSIDAWTVGLPNVRPAERLDVTAPLWPVEARGEPIAAIYCANMIHIAPWTATLGLLAGAGRVLAPGGLLVLYGPFRFDGAFTAPSNAAFDASLRQRDPAWGVRDLADVTAAAEAHGLTRTAVQALPANNHIVVFTKG